jgi:hypothetical protein
VTLLPVGLNAAHAVPNLNGRSLAEVRSRPCSDLIVGDQAVRFGDVIIVV